MCCLLPEHPLHLRRYFAAETHSCVYCTASIVGYVFGAQDIDVISVLG